jgi:phospholipid/cholesterol/gamma-HCH transport system substrate-binding protein
LIKAQGDVMDSRVRYKAVGFFILINLILFVSMLTWLVGGTGFEQVDRYIVYFEKQSLDGLQRDSLVTMRGIRVGVVEGYVISDDNIEQVKVLLRLEKGVPVKTDTRAVIRRNLLTGLAKIDLTGGTQSADLLQAAENDQYPVIPEEITQLDRIADEVPDLLEKFDHVAARLNLLFSEENISTLESTLKSLNSLTEELSAAAPSLRGSIENIEAISKTASRAIDKISGSEDVSGVADDIVIITQEIKEVVTELRKSASGIAPAVRKITRTSGRLQKDVSEIGKGVSTLSETYGDPAELLSTDK